MADDKYIIIMIAIVAIAGVINGAITGYVPIEKQSIEVGPSKGHAVVSIPGHAIEVSSGVFYLGSAIEKGKLVEGYAIIDYKEGYGKPGTECGNGVCEKGENKKKCPVDCADTSKCYGFLAREAKWKTIEPWIVNPANSRGLDYTFIFNNLGTDIGKWESAAGKNILGDGSTTTNPLVADTITPDNKNEVYFADIADQGAIAITIIWGIFRGPPSKRELVEWDQVYDDVDYDWSAAGEPSKMDFENIATHELGHSVGLGDLYTEECSEQTMYGYASYGETKKRTLESGDITGIRKLYK